jgi:thioredoxin reductase
MIDLHNCIIVGAGPAGLSIVLFLACYRLSITPRLSPADQLLLS